MLGTGNFPNFFGKYPVPGKWHSGTQTSSFCEEESCTLNPLLQFLDVQYSDLDDRKREAVFHFTSHKKVELGIMLLRKTE